MASITEETGDKSLFGWLTNMFKTMSIEPVAFLTLMTAMLSSMASQTLAIEKACRVNLKLSDEICDALRNQDSEEFADSERQVQEYISWYITYKSVIVSVLPCLLLVFAGGWMDITGRRKALMLLPVLGQVFLEISNVINVVFFYQLNVEVLIFSDAIFSSIFGGRSILFLAMFSFIVDITTENNRTYRLGLVSFAVYIGMPIGMSLSGIVLKCYGYLTVYLLVLALTCINCVYIIYALKDPPRSKENKVLDNRGIVHFLKIFFSPAHFLNSLKVVFKKTPNNRRTMLCVLIVTSCLIMGPTYGESAILYLSTRYRFNWDELQYSMFQTFNMIVNTIGSLFSILVMSKALGWHDSILGLTSSISKIASAFLYCFAASGTAFYFGPVVDMINGTSAIAVRSILSKQVEHHEISKLNSISGLVEVLMPLVYVPLFVQVYTNTMELLPGFVFLIGGAITVPPLLVFLWLFISHRRSQSKSKNKNEFILKTIF